ncbi:MAG: 2-hydroxychromene-2-carboxylate isomerase [Zavarzinia sp.]|nr:2-hydroxychromene-2-carboxylate isomerase [Zavarzinia sp.]
MKRLEFFFDVSSPWTYLAFMRIEAVAQAGGAELVYRPILVGGVFNAVNDTVYAARAHPNPVKQRYYLKDMQDWAGQVGVTIGQPPVFPVNSVKAMRGCFFAEAEGKLVPYASALFEAYWGRLEDISQDAVLASVAEAVDLPVDAFFAAIAGDDLKQRLRANTEELVARGGFGSPTMFVDGDDMYFGNDRLDLVRSALGRPA